MSMNNRVGKFKMSHRLLRADLDNIRWVLSHFVIVRAESLYYDDTIEYVAYSELFDEIPEGEIIPEYEIIIGEDKSVRAEKLRSNCASNQD